VYFSSWRTSEYPSHPLVIQGHASKHVATNANYLRVSDI